MSVRGWQWLHAAIDNTVAMAAVDGDKAAVDQGRQVRSAGWEAAHNHPRGKDGQAGWPPADDELTVSLPVAAWRFAIQELRRWDPDCTGSRQRRTGADGAAGASNYLIPG